MHLDIDDPSIPFIYHSYRRSLRGLNPGWPVGLNNSIPNSNRKQISLGDALVMGYACDR